jgi:DNA-3-methyladenine glycosylase II
LGREDVFSLGDLGLKNAMIKLYNLEQKPGKEILIEISSKWEPYRTYAARVLWKSLEINAL